MTSEANVRTASEGTLNKEESCTARHTAAALTKPESAAVIRSACKERNIEKKVTDRLETLHPAVCNKKFKYSASVPT